MVLWEFFVQIIETIIRDPFTQISGFMWMAVVLVAYMQKDDKSVKKLMLLSSLFWGTHFYLLWMYSGLAAIIIWVMRLCLSMKYHKNVKAFSFICIVTIITGYFTFDGFLSMLPIITSITGAYSYMFLESIKLRLMMLFNSSTWMMYNFFVGSISWVVNETLVQVILLATIYRMLHPEGWSHFYIWKLKQILWKTRRVDYDRFIFIHDKLSDYKKTVWHKFHHILHFDLRQFSPKKKTKNSKILSHS